MYLKHKNIPTPEDATVIWHYFSLPKFLGLLYSSQLFFCRQDQFDDKYEGHLSQADKEFLDGYPGNIAEYMQSDKSGCFYANCWTMSDYDQYVLWNTYASMSDGIAVRSTVGKIINALDINDKRGIYISAVNYYQEINGSTFSATNRIVNQLALGFSKREYFRAEKELRLLFWDNDAHLNDCSPIGVYFHVDLRKLIDSIYVAPKSYPWFQKAICHLISLYGLSDVQVYKSTI